MFHSFYKSHEKVNLFILSSCSIKITHLNKQTLTMHIHTYSADFCLIFVELLRKLSCAQNKAFQVRTDLNLSTGDKQTQLKAVYYTRAEEAYTDPMSLFD